MSASRRAFLLGLGAAATALSVPAARAATAAAANRIDLQTLLSIVGSKAGGTTWVHAFAHVLEMAPKHPPRVLFDELSVIECRIRPATAAEMARAGFTGSPSFHVTSRGATRAIEPGTRRRLDRFTNPTTGRASAVKPTRWQAAMLLTEDAWFALDDPAPTKRPRAAQGVANGGSEWYVFNSAASAGLDLGASGAVVESTGWRVRPGDLGQARVPSGYNHVCLTPVGLRSWLGYDDGSQVQLLENATGHKLFERSGIDPELAALLG